MFQVENLCQEHGLLAGILYASGIRVEPSSPELLTEIRTYISDPKTEAAFSDEKKTATRNLLRKGGFKPSGRNKPASEYLLRCLREDNFPYINNLVDSNNYCSLKSACPISLLQAKDLEQGLVLRLGTADESYVFNSVGHEISLKNLICTCRVVGEENTPIGNPIKDSVLGKITEETNSVVGIIYASKENYKQETLQSELNFFSDLLLKYGHAKSIESCIV